MRPRIFILFVLLVAAPLALLYWVGSMLVKEQQEQAQEAWRVVIQERLKQVNSVLGQEMRVLADSLDRLLDETSLQDVALYDLPKEQPLIRQAFLLSSSGRLLYPQTSSVHPSSEGAAFLRRTEAIWESGLPLSKINYTESNEGRAQQMLSNTEGEQSSSLKGSMAQQSIPAQGESFLKQEEIRPSVSFPGKGQPSKVAASGWHIWFYGNGPQLLFWQERLDGRTVGVELEMAALLSLLINQLVEDKAPTGEGFIRLTSADGKKVLHQWGQTVEDTPVAHSIAIDPPLGAWRLEYMTGKAELPTSDPRPVLLGAGAAGIILLALAWLFYRESSRELRDARQRVSFVNQVSHELKTPLTNIRLYTEMAQQRLEHGDDTVVQHHLEVVEAETSRLSRLIHNVLTFAREQRDHLEVNVREASLDDVVGRVAATWQPGLLEKGMQMDIRLDGGASLQIDPDAVEQILGNLLSNVEKYAASGGWVGIRTQRESEVALLIVEDRGPGVPSSQEEAIFAPFVRLSSAVNEGVSGTGIGLGIARRMAELHGGTLSVEQGDPKGARFIVRFPAR